jgi:hypothetical protein
MVNDFMTVGLANMPGGILLRDGLGVAVGFGVKAPELRKTKDAKKDEVGANAEDRGKRAVLRSSQYKFREKSKLADTNEND